MKNISSQGAHSLEVDLSVLVEVELFENLVDCFLPHVAADDELQVVRWKYAQRREEKNKKTKQKQNKSAIPPTNCEKNARQPGSARLRCGQSSSVHRMSESYIMVPGIDLLFAFKCIIDSCSISYRLSFDIISILVRYRIHCRSISYPFSSDIVSFVVPYHIYIYSRSI